MSKDDILREYIKKVFISPNVVAFGSEKARNFLEGEFGLTISSLLRPFSVESSQEFIWPPNNELKNKSKTEEGCKDVNWESRSCRECVGDLYLIKDAILNKPLNSKSIWIPSNKLEGVRITLQENEVVNESFGIKFLSLCDSYCGDNLNGSLNELVGNSGMLNSLRSYDGFDKLFPYTEIVSNLLISKGGKQLEYVLKEFFQFKINQDVSDDLVLYNNQLPFWFKRWFDAFNEEYSYLNDNNITQPIGGIIFVDLSEDDPIESIIEITDSLKTGKNFDNIGGNSNYYIYGRKEFSNGKCIPHYLQESYLCDFPFVYIFINDENSGFNFMENDQNIISSFKLSFPDSICYIWNIRGSKTSDLNNNEGSIVFPGTFCHPFKEFNKTYEGNRYFLHDELEQLNSFIIDSVKNVFVPWLETTINRLNNYVIQSRKGIKNHLRILWRKPRNDSINSSSEGLLSTLGVGTVFNNIEERSQIFEHEISLFTSKQHSSVEGTDLFGSNSGSNETYNSGKKTASSSSSSFVSNSGNNNLYYSSTSLEGQTRLLADLLLVSGFYQQSVNFYKQILTEYKLDKSFLHIGSTLFSISIAQILSDGDFESVSSSCFSSSNYFQRNEDEFGKLLSIKPLFIAVIYFFSAYRHDEILLTDCDNSLNITKSLIESLIKLSNELQNSNKRLRPRNLFSINSYYLSKNDTNSIDIDSKLCSVFGILNFTISIIINFVSNNVIFNNRSGNASQNGTGNRFYHSIGSLYSNSLNMCIANTAQSFQKINLFSLSLQNYLIFLHQIKRFSYKYIEKYFKIHSARLFQKMSMFSQATIIYISLIMDIINERLNLNHELVSDCNNESVSLRRDEEFYSKKLNVVNFCCYNEFINSFSIYVSQTESNSERNNELFNSPSSQSQLKIPLPILLPFGSLLIIETDSDSFSKTFGRESDILVDANYTFNCGCSNTPIITDLLKQNNFCNHKYHKRQNVTKNKVQNSVKPSNNIIGADEDEFCSLVEKINALLEVDVGLDSSEISELKSQYLIKKLKCIHNQHYINNSTRFSTIGKMCSVEFYLYNPLSFPIKCESMQLWGHLRIQDGSTGKIHICKDSDTVSKDVYVNNQSGIVFFEKNITLEPRELKVQKLSVLPLESGELFLLGISFFLEGKIPIRQNFSTCSIYFDKLAGKFNFQNKYNIHTSSQSRDNYGIQKVNILSHSQDVSVTFGNITKSCNGITTDHHTDRDDSLLYSGIKYNIPIKIVNQIKDRNANKDSLLLVIPSFNTSHYIDVNNCSNDYIMLNNNNSGGKNCQGFIFKLANHQEGIGVSSEFILSIWVNSKCRGSVYFVLLNCKKTGDDQSGSNSTQLQNQSSSLLKGKVSRCITFANLGFNFENSISASCTVFPGKNQNVNKLLLRIKNESLDEISIYDISSYPSKWLASNSNFDENSFVEKRDCDIEAIPKIRISVNDCDETNNLLNGNYHNLYSRGNNPKLMLIRPDETLQLLLDLHNFINLNKLSIMNIDLVLSWLLTQDFYEHNSVAGSQTGGNLTSTNCFGMICIRQVNLSDPFSVVDIRDTFKEKHQPISLLVNTRNNTLKDYKQKCNTKDCLNFESLDIIEANISVMNVSLDSTIMCTMVCDKQNSQVDYELVPSKNNSSNKVDSDNECTRVKHKRTSSSILESGELNWVGTTLTHFRLEPRNVVRFKLISIIPFKGIFSTSSIKVIMRNKIPFFSSNNKHKGKSHNGISFNKNKLNTSGAVFVYYLNWKPEIHLDGFKKNENFEFLKFQLKNHIDYLEHSPFSTNVGGKYSEKNNRFLPAYIEKSKSNKVQKKNSRHRILDTYNNSNGKLMSSKTNNSGDIAFDTLFYDINNINHNIAETFPNGVNNDNVLYLLNYWIYTDELSNSRVGDVFSVGFSATQKSRKFEIDYYKDVILQKPSQTRYIIRT
ncbi:putative low complexity [Cryptosporidium xiaoi]|uniref:Low complexity n=1 Tax=Cryptosporidium xiaoi TaxID=659607 RepID=A0AAV9XY30_9CRYT